MWVLLYLWWQAFKAISAPLRSPSVRRMVEEDGRMGRMCEAEFYRLLRNRYDENSCIGGDLPPRNLVYCINCKDSCSLGCVASARFELASAPLREGSSVH